MLEITDRNPAAVLRGHFEQAKTDHRPVLPREELAEFFCRLILAEIEPQNPVLQNPDSSRPNGAMRAAHGCTRNWPYRKQAGEDVEYWINTKTFIEDICQGYDKDKVCEVLHGICWLLKNEEKGRWQHQRRVGKARRWYFVLANEAQPETEE